MITKRKYWYRTTIRACVLCGYEDRYKERVYDESEKGTFWIDFACDVHFL